MTGRLTMPYEIHRISADNQIIDPLPCAACGADLVGCNPSGYCTQCGEPLNQSLVGRGVCRIDENEMLAEEITCRGDGCGYNLRGIDPLGDCPECKTQIAYSLEVDLLRYANPGWLKKVATGITWYFITMAMTLLLIVIMILVNIALRAAGQTDPVVIAQQSQVIQLGLQLLIGCFSIVAIFMLTAADPDDQATLGSPSSSAAFLARLLTVLSFVISIAAMVCSIMKVPKAELFQFPSGLIGAFAYLALLTHMQRLALKIPDDRMERHLRSIKWAWLACAIVMTVGGALVMLSGFTQAALAAAQAPGTSPFASMSAGGIAMFASGSGLGCLGMVGNTVFTIWVLVIMFKLRKPYVRAAQIAIAK
ncbi:MAG: hypothetical protein D8M59_11230 [Planctomycetes bacterium]|nr:hypothetical protein [Planctomycetota bacterium]